MNLIPILNDINARTRLAKDRNGLTGGGSTNLDGIPTRATATITFTINMVAGDTITLNGVVWTFVASGATGNQTNISGSLAATLTQLAIDLNASVNVEVVKNVYTVSTTVLTISYKNSNFLANDYTVAASVGVPNTGNLTGGLDFGDANSGGVLLMIVVTDTVSLYRLRSGTDAEASPGKIRPDDYEGTNNQRVWVLEALAAAGGGTFVSKSGDTMTGLLVLSGDPVVNLGAATKQYVDATANGLDYKGSVRVATAAALPAYTRTVNVITATSNGALAAVDSVTLILNDRLLLKDGAAGADNGLYFVSQVGTGGTPYTLTRTTDADSSAEVTAGLFVNVEEGTVNADTFWVLTTNNPITLNTTALTFTQLLASLFNYLSLAGGSMTGAINEAKGADIASAGTTDIGAATGNFVHVTGTTTITALGTVQAGTRRIVEFTGILTLTHNGTSLILPGAANITTAAGDIAIFVSEGSGNWRCVSYTPAVWFLRRDGGTLTGAVSGTAITLSGQFIAQNTTHLQSSQSFGSTPAWDFTADGEKTMTVTGAITSMSTSNRAAGRKLTLFLTDDGSARAIAPNGSWKALGAALPANLTASKTIVMTLHATGTNETDIYYAWSQSL